MKKEQTKWKKNKNKGGKRDVRGVEAWGEKRKKKRKKKKKEKEKKGEMGEGYSLWGLRIKNEMEVSDNVCLVGER